MIQVAGEHGATRNAYGSLYLWKDPTAFSQFLTGPRFQNVISTFGRPSVETYLPVALASGRSMAANFVSFAFAETPSEQPLADMQEIESTFVSVSQSDQECVFQLSAMDTERWRISRVRISATPGLVSGNELYQIAHFARPGF